MHTFGRSTARLATDPHEWTNLAARPEHATQKAALARHVPDPSAYACAHLGKWGGLGGKRGEAEPGGGTEQAGDAQQAAPDGRLRVGSHWRKGLTCALQ